MKTNTPPPLPPARRKAEPRKFPVCSEETAIERIKRSCAPCEYTTYGAGKHTVIILPEAWNELREMICFGKKRAVNFYEQQYQGMGHFVVSANGRLCVIISHFVYIYSAERGRTHASVIKGGNTSFLDLLASERAIYNCFEAKFNRDETGRELDPFLREGPSEMVLFGHTHPDLGVFFSEPDRKSSCAGTDFPAVTFVCDPIRKQMKAMVGIEEADARVLVFSYLSGNGEQPPVKADKDAALLTVREPRRETVQPPAQVEIEKTLTPAAAKTTACDPLETELGKVCTALLAEKYVKGKFRVYRGFWGALHVEFSMKRKYPREKNRRKSALDGYGR